MKNSFPESGSCNEILFLISREIDGEISLVEKEEIENHLKECSPCRLEKSNLEELHQLTTQISNWWQSRDFSSKREELNQKIMASLPPREFTSSLPWGGEEKSQWHWKQFLPLVAACLIVIIHFAFFASQPEKPSTQPRYWIKANSSVQLCANEQQANWESIRGPIEVRQGYILRTSQKSDIQIGEALFLTLYRKTQIRIRKGPSVQLEKGKIRARLEGAGVAEIVTPDGVVHLGRSSAFIEIQKRELGQKKETGITEVLALSGKVKVENSLGKMWLKKDQKALLTSLLSPQISTRELAAKKSPPPLEIPELILSGQAPAFQRARSRWRQQRLHQSLLRARKETMKEVRSRSLSLPHKKQSLKAWVLQLNDGFASSPYLLLLSDQSRSYQPSPSVASVGDLLDEWKARFSLQSWASLDLLVLGSQKSLEDYCEKNDFSSPSLPSPRWWKNFSKDKVTIAFRDLSLSQLPQHLYREHGVKLHFTKEVVEIPGRLSYNRNKTCWKDFLLFLQNSMGITWQAEINSPGSFYLFYPPQDSPLATLRQEKKEELNQLNLRYLGRATHSGQHQAALKSKWGQKFCSPGEKWGKIHLLKIVHNKAFVSYRGLIFVLKMGQ